MLQTLQLMQGEGYRPEAPVEPPAGGVEYGEMVPVPGGPFVMGTGDRARALDNERDAPEVHVPGFLMDRTPVTNAPYLEFVESGGYGKRELWDPAGWECIKQERISAPKHWYQPEPHSWWTARFVFDGPLDPALPVVLVSRYEADAYARWAGKHLPTEAEWEKAASWDPTSRTGRLFPWGDGPPTPEKANLDQLAPAGAYPAEASAYGVLGMIGTPGSGPPATSPPTRASSLSPTRSTPKSSSGPTTRSCAAAPGRLARRPSAPPSATGTSR